MHAYGDRCSAYLRVRHTREQIRRGPVAFARRGFEVFTVHDGDAAWRYLIKPAFCNVPATTVLKPEYAEALQAIEIAGTPVKTFAEQKSLSASNAAVRVFRARARRSRCGSPNGVERVPSMVA